MPLEVLHIPMTSCEGLKRRIVLLDNVWRVCGDLRVGVARGPLVFV
jgi:hypothetical protein